MDWISVALANLQLSLQVASGAYARFSDHPEIHDSRALLSELSAERDEDATSIGRAVELTELPAAVPMLNTRSAARMLGLSRGMPTSLHSIARQVRLSESKLAQLSTQLGTVVDNPVLQTALNLVSKHIGDRRDEISEFRKATTKLESREANTAASFVEKVEGREVAVWFGTNRAYDGKRKFLGQRGSHVQYGRCKVFVPIDREVGSLGSGFFGRLIHGDNRIKVKNTEVIPGVEFWQAIRRELHAFEEPERHALIYIHGYWTTFEMAALRTAQLKADLGFAGPTAFFSWPSLGTLFGYPGDVAAIQSSEVAIRNFLIDFATQSGASAVHIIAHSMGNQGLLRAMDAIARDAAISGRVRFGQVILAAPDVDRELFAELASAYVKLSQRSTLYISKNDMPVNFSAWIHDYDRVGIAPPVTIIPGMDTINVSKVNLGIFGHSYVAELRPILSDIHALLSSNSSPDSRFGLRPAGDTDSRHWVVV